MESTSKDAVYLAAEKGHDAVLKRLLASGADPHALAIVTTPHATSRTSPLWAARRGGHAAAAEVLREAGGRECAETLAETLKETVAT